MAYPASLLITRAWVLSGIVSRNMQGVQGNQSSDGLFLLNELLDIKSADITLIPYFKHTDLALIAGQEMYFVPGLVSLETMTFNIGTVRYAMRASLRTEFFGDSRALDIQSLPYEWYFERVLGGANIYVYFVPQQNYDANLNGKYALTDVTLGTDLTTVYDPFYIAYLRYALAQYMCNYYDMPFSLENQKMLSSIIVKLQNVSPPDLSLRKSSTLNRRRGINYGDVNIGHSWRP